MMNTWGEWWCMVWHRSLVIVRNYGSSKRVLCTKCKREYGMHDGARAILPWYEVSDIYRDIDELAARK